MTTIHDIPFHVDGLNAFTCAKTFEEIVSNSGTEHVEILINGSSKPLHLKLVTNIPEVQDKILKSEVSFDYPKVHFDQQVNCGEGCAGGSYQYVLDFNTSAIHIVGSDIIGSLGRKK